MFFKKVENTGGKGEIAHYKQFLLYPQYFHATWTADTNFLPTRSRFGPTSMAFQLNEYFDGQFVNPS